VIAPVPAFSTKWPDAGKAPLARAYVVVPSAPVAAALALYAVPTVAPDNEAGKVMVGPVTVMVCADEVAVRAVGVPESFIEKTMLL
jgi:hypothetical protein